MGYFIACIKCGEQIRNKAPKCRHCGYQYKEIQWGCLIPILIIMAAIFALIFGWIR